MEACLLITNTNKPKKRRGKVLIINAVEEVRQDKNMGYLEEPHIQKIYKAFKAFEDQESFAKVATLADLEKEKFNLAINRYIRPREHNGGESSFSADLENWLESSSQLEESMKQLFATLETRGK